MWIGACVAFAIGWLVGCIGTLLWKSWTDGQMDAKSLDHFGIVIGLKRKKWEPRRSYRQRIVDRMRNT